MNIVRSITQKLLKLGIIITAFLIINSLLKINDNNISNTVKASSIEEKAEKIPVFTFHRVVSDKLKKERFMKDEWVHSAKVFDEQMKYLYDNGYQTISLDELYCWYKGNCEFPKKTVVITFDDGNADDFYIVMPILRKYNFKSTTFIVGNRTYDKETKPYIENKRTFITKEMIRKTKKIYPKMDYQSHTYNMHAVDPNGKERVLNYTREQIRDDFKNNEAFKFDYLAYPYGIYNEEIIEQLEESEYKLAFIFRKHDYVTRNSKQYEMPRIKINGFSTVEDIKKWLNY